MVVREWQGPKWKFKTVLALMKQFVEGVSCPPLQLCSKLVTIIWTLSRELLVDAKRQLAERLERERVNGEMGVAPEPPHLESPEEEIKQEMATEEASEIK